MSNFLFEVNDLKKYFFVRKSLLWGKKETIRAVDGVSFGIRRREILALVGETGAGKTTVGKLILRSIEPTAGTIFFEGHNILALHKNELRKLRRDIQMIFQNPFASLSPRMKVKDILSEPLKIHGVAKGSEKALVKEMLEKMGLTPVQEFINRYPHEFSGGQRQRIAIARALILNPKFIVADEPVSSLDMSVRSGILTLMQDLKEELGLTYLLISHDLSMVRYMSDRIAVMYFGKLVELASTEDIFNLPLHPYTNALIAAVPTVDPRARRKLVKLKGEIPSLINPPLGCIFHTRCPYSKPKCLKEEPQINMIRKGHYVACHMPLMDPVV